MSTHKAHESSQRERIVDATSVAENLRFAISDHQEMIRGTDLKAEVLGILITGLLTIVTLEGSVSIYHLNGWVGICSIVLALFALLFIGLVLWPRSDPWRELNLGDYKPSRVMYPPAKADPQKDIHEATRQALATDWPAELTYELAKLSLIRAAKQKWFRRALWVAGISVLAVTFRLFVPVANGTIL